MANQAIGNVWPTTADIVKISIRHIAFWLGLLLTCASLPGFADPVTNPFPILLEHAQKGNVDAMFEVAKFYQQGEYTDQNWQQAIYWYEKAVENNHVPAMLALGRVLLHDAGKQKANIPRALQLIEQAATAGDAEAQFQLGQLFEGNDGVEQDLPSAVRWYRAAELQKYPGAKRALRRCIRTYKTAPSN